MSDERTRDRGNLFANPDKKKPSQPDLQGDCTIDGTAYEIRGWKRGDQLEVSLAPPRGDRNTYPPDVFRGALDAAPEPPAPPVSKGGGGKGKKSKGGDDPPAKPAPKPVSTEPAWTGTIVSEEVAYAVRGFEKMGKSGLYWTLAFERLAEKPAPTSELVD